MRYILFGFDKPYIALPERAVVVVDLGRQFDEGKSPGKIGHGQSFQFVEVAAYRDDIRIANHVFRSADTDVCLLVPVIIVGYIQLEGKGKVTDRTDMPLWSVVRYTNCKRSRVSMRTIHIGRCSRSTTQPCRTSGRKSASSWSTISAGSESWRSRSTARGNSGRKFVIHSNLFNFVQSMG